MYLEILEPVYPSDELYQQAVEYASQYTVSYMTIGFVMSLAVLITILFFLPIVIDIYEWFCKKVRNLIKSLLTAASSSEEDKRQE